MGSGLDLEPKKKIMVPGPVLELTKIVGLFRVRFSKIFLPQIKFSALMFILILVASL